MSFDIPLQMSRGLLTATGTQISIRHRERIPPTDNLLVISNHRSFLDAPLLMLALERSIGFACHHYMSQVPVLKEIVTAFGSFPLSAPGQCQQTLFQQASDLLQSHRPVGIFPEGAQPMINVSRPRRLSQFHRGFAHLALRLPVQTLAILPVAISALEETVNPVAPLRFFSLFAPSEPLFDQPGWHAAVHYHRVNLSIGHPIWITDADREKYHGKQAGLMAKALTRSCYSEVAQLLDQGFA